MCGMELRSLLCCQLLLTIPTVSICCKYVKKLPKPHSFKQESSFEPVFDKMDGEQLNRKLQTAVDTMLQSIDANKMRPMQKKTYLAMAACFDNKTASSQQIESCLNSSSHGVKVSQQIIQQEMNQFQSRLQRCAADCEDSVRDKNPNLSDQASVDRAQGQMTSCMSICVGESSFLVFARLHFNNRQALGNFLKIYFPLFYLQKNTSLFLRELKPKLNLKSTRRCNTNTEPNYNLSLC